MIYNAIKEAEEAVRQAIYDTLSTFGECYVSVTAKGLVCVAFEDGIKQWIDPSDPPVFLFKGRYGATAEEIYDDLIKTAKDFDLSLLDDSPKPIKDIENIKIINPQDS